MKPIILEPDQEVVINTDGLELRMTYKEIIAFKLMEMIDANRPKLDHKAPVKEFDR